MPWVGRYVLGTPERVRQFLAGEQRRSVHVYKKAAAAETSLRYAAVLAHQYLEGVCVWFYWEPV
jgi:hypothetical protein